MQAITSFIKKKPKHKPRPPFRHIDPLLAAHPYDSTDVIDIRDQANEVPEEVDATHLPPLGSAPPSRPPRPNSASPRLDLNISAEPTGWLSLDLFEQEPDLQGGLLRGGDVQNQIAQETSDSSDDDKDDVEEFVSENEQIFAGSKSMSSGFLPAVAGRHQDQCMPTIKKPPPTPIKIPNYNGAQSQAQILRSGDTSSFGYLHPQSQLSTPGSSAISGQTLARALIANPYTLSPDNHSSRFRNGLVGLTRSDSATLPREEHEFMTSSSLSPLRAPMPPVPANAESRYVPPKTPRTPAPDRHKRLKPYSSTGSLSSNFVGDSADLDPLATRRSQGVSAGSSDELVMRATHRISRISEASSVPPTPTHARAITNTSLTDSIESPSSYSSSGYSHVPLAASVIGALSPSGLPTSPRSPSSPGHSLEHDPSPLPKDVDALLGYHSFTEPSMPYVTVFSPISEESASQLSPSPPTQKIEQRSYPLDDASRSSPSNASFGGRTDKVSSKTEVRIYKRHPASPLGRRPRSVQGPQRSSTGSRHGQSFSTSSSRASSEWGELVPPPTIFNRQRSGSIPSSIKVTRDSQDSTAYQITVAPLPEEENGSPISSHSNDLRQRFPETPVVSPPWSSTSGITRENSVEYASLAMPTSPQSAMFASGIDEQDMARRILVSRAASFVCNSKSSERASELHDTADACESYSRVSSPPSPRKEDVLNDDDVRPSVSGHSIDSEYGDSSSTTSGVSPASEDTGFKDSVNPVLPHNISSFASGGIPLSVPLHDASHSVPHLEAGAGPADVDSDTTIIVNAPLSPTPSLPPASYNEKVPLHSKSMDHDQQAYSPLSLLDPTTEVSQSSSALIGPGSGPTELPVNDPSTPPPRAHSPKAGSVRVFELPPSYDNIFGVRESELELGSNTSYAMPSLDEAPTPATNISSPILNKKIRSRPPLPAGPRRPSRPGRVIPFLSGSGARDLDGASTSDGPSPLHDTIHSVSDGLASPLFQTPPINWRGSSMEVVKWTFTSAQLQSIVSRAIRESSKASSIRLLQLEVLDNDIPEERRWLEKRMMDCKSQYKQKFRNRNELFSSLSAFANSTGEDGIIKQVEELKKISATLDTLAQDLHSADVQLAELDSLCHIHSYSALAVALRKLNKSFVKQLAETQVLRKQVDILEEERDEAWKQAEKIANRCDIMSGNLETPPFDYANQAAQLSASRKSSNRISKAGLRNSSQRSSLVSSRSSGINMLSTRVSLLSSKIPPVPPVPRRKPSDIRTDLIPRSTALSTDMSTPNTETRDMIQAQEELYQMLGLTATKLHRSSSVKSLTDPAPFNHFHRSRPVSAPSSATLTEAYHASIVDREAMVATFEIVSNQ